MYFYCDRQFTVLHICINRLNSAYALKALKTLLLQYTYERLRDSNNVYYDAT